MPNQLFAKKPLHVLLAELHGEQRLRRCLGPVQLSSLGVGAIIGTGIFVLTGVAAHDRTGPALFRTPWKSTILTGICVALMGAFLPLRILAELVNIGTLLAFVIVCAAVLIMRKTNPDAERPFRAPLVPFVPIAGILCCLVLMFSLPPENWLRLGIWLAIGLAIYFAYGKKHSLMAETR
jgi:amino acid transporter